MRRRKSKAPAPVVFEEPGVPETDRVSVVIVETHSRGSQPLNGGTRASCETAVMNDTRTLVRLPPWF